MPPSHDREEQIRDRAYDLWQQAGKPDGRDQEFWHLAWREIVADETGEDPVPIDAVDEPDNSDRTMRADMDRLTPAEATGATMPGSPRTIAGSEPEKETRKPL
jgi:hypothetical protein